MVIIVNSRVTVSLAVLFAVGTPVQVQAEELRNGGKLLLTNGITSLEGSSGGGLASWSVVAGNETANGVGASGHVTIVELPDYRLQNHGIAIGLFDQVELSYARQNLDTKSVGAALGLGQGYMISQDIFGAKLRLVGDLVYGDPLLPQIAVGVHHKRNLDGNVTGAVGALGAKGTDYYLSATKLFLSESILANATVRYTNANQAGLLGFGGDLDSDKSIQFEGSLAYQLSQRLVIGGEYRTKPDNLSSAQEDDWFDLFAVYALNRNLTVTAAYTDLGSVATAAQQRGAFVSLQAAF